METKNTVRVYDKNMNKIAYLKNASDIQYELSLNNLSFASFKMPADDPENESLELFNFVEIFDNGERVDLFRIIKPGLLRNKEGIIFYECEHVLATLIDDVLFKYHQIGNLGTYTNEVIGYILSKQIIKHWVLDECDFTRQFEYKWENENLLAALFSVSNVFNEEYKWVTDTTCYPWKLSLKKIESEFKADIMYKKNMLEIKKTVDATNIVTKLLLLGYGEGDNQLDITSINDGRPYLLADEESINKYGVKSSILVDRRFEDVASLKAYGESMLGKSKQPYVSYDVKAIDLFTLKPNIYEKFVVGDIVRVIDKEDNICVDLPIVQVKKSDVAGNPGNIEIVVANKSKDLAGTMADLASRNRINEVYAQGATNQMMINYADNADPNNPAILRIYIPDTMVRINKCILNYNLEPFRGYTKAISSADSTTQSTSTSSAQMPTTSNASTQSPTTTSVSTQTPTTSSSPSQTSGASSSTTTSSHDMQLSNILPSSTTNAQQTHNHGINSNERLLTGFRVTKNSSGAITDITETYTRFVWSGAHTHGNHSHDMRHTHSIPTHTHTVTIPGHSHQVTIPGHSHSVTIPGHSHQVSIPGHSHAMEFGIYQGTTASRVTIAIDNKNIPNSEKEIDITNFLATDSAGKIIRNSWHTIRLTPDRMTRITANVFLQIFTQSRGGGDY